MSGLKSLWKFMGTELWSYWRPEARQAREGAQTGAPTKACVKRVPSCGAGISISGG